MYKNIRSLHPIHWIALLLISSSTVCAQEICTNGVDDDGDNLIDLNDSDDCI